MEGIANKIREGKMKRSAGVPTVILVLLLHSSFILTSSFLFNTSFCSLILLGLQVYYSRN
jgi:hypothetical protein